MKRQTSAAVLVALLASAALVGGQTQVTAPKNKYSPAEDVKLGREAAAEVARQMPMLNDDRVDSYVERIGERLVGSIPAEFQHNEFRYTFDVVTLTSRVMSNEAKFATSSTDPFRVSCLRLVAVPLFGGLRMVSWFATASTPYAVVTPPVRDWP